VLTLAGLKIPGSVLSASCTSKARYNSCLCGNEQPQVSLKMTPNHQALPHSLTNVHKKQDSSLPYWWVSVCWKKALFSRNSLSAL